MTEKRFTTVELPKPNKWGIWYDGAYLSTYQVCTLLNEYVDVKKENEQLKKDFDSCSHNWALMYDEAKNKVEELSEENEQLKSTINTLTHDNTKMKKVLNTTKKENKYIKNTIQEAYNNERTQLGKSVLKQLLNNIEEIQ